MQLIVLAAGLGSRFGGTKQITPIGPNGEIIADYSVYDALHAGFTNIIFVISAELEEWFTLKFAPLGKYIDYVFQSINDLPLPLDIKRAKPWGTGHALYAARGKITGNFAVINADDYYGRSAFLKLAQFNYSENNHTLITFPLGNTLTEHGTVSRGLCVTNDGFLTDIRETTGIYISPEGIFSASREPLTASAAVSMNAWGFDYSALTRVEHYLREFLRENAKRPEAEFYLPHVAAAMITDGAKIHIQNSNEKWYGITYKEDLETVRAAISQMTDNGLYPLNLWEDL